MVKGVEHAHEHIGRTELFPLTERFIVNHPSACLVRKEHPEPFDVTLAQIGEAYMNHDIDRFETEPQDIEIPEADNAADVHISATALDIKTEMDMEAMISTWTLISPLRLKA